MLNIGQIIVDQIKSSRYVPSDLGFSFYYEDTYLYLNISATMPVDTSFTFYMRSEEINDDFSLPDDNTNNSNQDTVR
jgi:hypothetical protein